jgi:hypothetical protein
MFSALKTKLEATGAPGELLQAIGVGGAFLTLLVWTIVSPLWSEPPAASSETVDAEARDAPTPRGRTVSSVDGAIHSSSDAAPGRGLPLERANWRSPAFSSLYSSHEDLEDPEEGADREGADRTLRIIEVRAPVSADVARGLRAISIAEAK